MDVHGFLELGFEENEEEGVTGNQIGDGNE
jgi:hypothetical protein